MHNVLMSDRRRALPAIRRRTAIGLAAMALLLAGCQYFIYVPLLIITPFMPIIQFAIAVAARYGPLLLMMMAENEPGTTPAAPPMMIAAEPAGALQATRLDDLETSIEAELASGSKLRAVGIVEIAKLSPQWLEEQARRAHRQNCSLRLVFVDSRRFARGETMTASTRAALAAAKVRLQASDGLARQAAGGSADRLDMTAPEPVSPATASIMAGMAGVLNEGKGGMQ